MLGDRESASSIFLRNCQNVSPSACMNLPFSSEMYDSPNYLISLPIFEIVTVSGFSHFSECVLIFHCYFILHFIDETVEQSCNVLIGNSYVFFHGMSIEVFFPFKNWQPLQLFVCVCHY